MTTYTLSVTVDQKWVQRFNTNGTKLCFASSVTSGKENYNVVASSKVVAGTVKFEWVEEYAIAASHDEFQNGVKITASTTAQPIFFQQSYTLPWDWTDRTPKTDKAAPMYGFQFVNEAVDATAVLYKKVDGKFTSIYASFAGPLPPGIENMIPKIKARVWFANSMESNTMISTFETTPMTIDFTGKSVQTVGYDSNGIWSAIEGTSDWSLARLEKELELLEEAHKILGHRPKKAIAY